MGRRFAIFPTLSNAYFCDITHIYTQVCLILRPNNVRLDLASKFVFFSKYRLPNLQLAVCIYLFSLIRIKLIIHADCTEWVVFYSYMLCFTSVCLCVCFSARYLKTKLGTEMFQDEPQNQFIWGQKVKGQCYDSQKHFRSGYLHFYECWLILVTNCGQSCRPIFGLGSAYQGLEATG